MKLLCLIFLAATICLVGQAFAENEHATTPVLPWQSQLAPRAENLPPGARAWPIFARETFVFPPRTNDPSDKLLSVVIAPMVAPKSVPATSKSAKPSFTEYRLEIFGAKPKPKETAIVKVSEPAKPVVLAMAARPALPESVGVATTKPAPATSGEPIFSKVPSANPNFTLAALSTIPSKSALIEASELELPKPIAKEEANADEIPAPAKPKNPPKKTKSGKDATTSPKLIVNADNGLGGKVASADESGRFVILNFPLGQMPRVDSTMTLYRHGVKSATIKITGPQRDDNVAADVLSGIPAEGDSAREE